MQKMSPEILTGTVFGLLQSFGLMTPKSVTLTTPLCIYIIIRALTISKKCNRLTVQP